MSIKSALLGLGKIGLALPIVAAGILVALDVAFLGDGNNTLLSWIGVPVVLVGGYIYLYRISRGQ